LIAGLIPGLALAAKNDRDSESAADEKPRLSAQTLAGLQLRLIGPALTAGRIGDIAIHPSDENTWYVAVASGGVWKTPDRGTNWEPLFDDEGSYSIGCLAIDPKNPLVVWVGTGENNSQRSVGYGDGLYRSADGGRTWKKVGLEESEHIGKIVIHPEDTDTVYVAAQGPLWNSGGHRGLYKTTDGGETWRAVLEISEDTGVTDVVMDPRDPDVLYAAAYQRRRHVWTLINGGPESAIYKSTDAGESWEKLERGLPKVDLGRIGLAISPVNPDVIYAIVEAAGDEGGFFRSIDAGSHWEKRSDYVARSPQYYQEIVPDPKDVDRVYSLDTWMQVTEDGGKTFRRVGKTPNTKHVDDHALWIDPDNTAHLVNGNDGGVYESYDRGMTWRFIANLPVTQFYKVTPDNAEPFYNVYGGTQDNATLGGPARTPSRNGITNADWFVTVFGDGFKTQIDPEDPNIVYSQWQYGGLVRFDRLSGERIDIQPQPTEEGEALRWNWSSALLISPHSHTRLYYGAQKLYRSDDRGDTWRAVSPDLTRQVDRNQLEVMGKIWSIDAVAKNASTSFYGTIVSLSESPLVEGLIYVGTDDGLVQVSEDGGENWREIAAFPGVPEASYVSDLEASLHDPDTVFAAFDNHKRGDFQPYLLKSTDRGRTWTRIAGDLPERGSVYSVVQDHDQPGLLFAGTEFGVHVTVDGGQRWVELTGGMPTIAARDLEIQRRENDLVVGTFGRGIYILDDYTPLREISEAKLDEQEAMLFPIKRTPMFIPRARLGLPGKAMQGDAFYTAENPPFGAVFTYYLRDGLKTLREQRHEREAEVEKEGGTVRIPSWEELRAEAREDEPAIVLTVRDRDGNVVRRLTGPTAKGVHRIAWNLRLPAPDPVELGASGPRAPWDDDRQGPLAVPGTYTVSLAQRVQGEMTELAGPVTFETYPMGAASLRTKDWNALVDFQKQTGRLQRTVLGAVEAAREAGRRLDHLEATLAETPGAEPELADRVDALQERLADIRLELIGDPVVSGYNEPTEPSIRQRIGRIVYGHWSTTSAPTRTQQIAFEIARDRFKPVLENLRQLVLHDLTALENQFEERGAPWTPGRVPEWPDL
jgi:photosystem II stability/assembly factor-like uncharacterized protein